MPAHTRRAILALVLPVLLGSLLVQAQDAPLVIQAGAVLRVIGEPPREGELIGDFYVVEQALRLDLGTQTRDFQVAGLLPPVSPLALELEIPGWEIDSLVFEQTRTWSDTSWVTARLTRTPDGNRTLWIRADWRDGIPQHPQDVSDVLVGGPIAPIAPFVDAATDNQLPLPGWNRSYVYYQAGVMIVNWESDSLLHARDVFPEQWSCRFNHAWSMRRGERLDLEQPLVHVYGKTRVTGRASGVLRYLVRLRGLPQGIRHLGLVNLRVSTIAFSPFFSLARDTLRGIPWVRPVDSLMRPDSPWRRTLEPVTCFLGYTHAVEALPPRPADADLELVAAPLDFLRHPEAPRLTKDQGRRGETPALLTMDRIPLACADPTVQEEMRHSILLGDSLSLSADELASAHLCRFTVLPLSDATGLGEPDIDPEASDDPMLQARLVLTSVASPNGTLENALPYAPRLALVAEPLNQAARYAPGGRFPRHPTTAPTALPLEAILRRHPCFPRPVASEVLDLDKVFWEPVLKGYREYMAARIWDSAFAGLADVEGLKYRRSDRSVEDRTVIHRSLRIELVSDSPDSVAFTWHERLDQRPWRIVSCSHPARLAAEGYAADIDVALAPGESTCIVLEVEGDPVLPLVAPVPQSTPRRAVQDLN